MKVAPRKLIDFFNDLIVLEALDNVRRLHGWLRFNDEYNQEGFKEGLAASVDAVRKATESGVFDT